MDLGNCQWSFDGLVKLYLSCCLNERRRVNGCPSLYWAPVSGSTLRSHWSKISPHLAHPGRLTPSAGLVVQQLSVTDFQLAGPTILRPRLEIWTFHDKVGPAKSNWVRLGGGNKCQCWRLQISNLKVRIWKATSSSLLFRSLRLGPEVTWKKGFQANMDIWDSLDNDILDNSGQNMFYVFTRYGVTSANIGTQSSV